MQHSIGEVERLDEVFDDLIAAWRNGDDENIAKLVTDDFKEQFPEIFHTLFSARNAAWLPGEKRVWPSSTVSWSSRRFGSVAT